MASFPVVTLVEIVVTCDGQPFDDTTKKVYNLPAGGVPAIVDLLASNVKDTNKGKSGNMAVTAYVNGVQVASADKLGKSEYRRIEDRIVAGFKKFRT